MAIKLNTWVSKMNIKVLGVLSGIFFGVIGSAIFSLVDTVRWSAMAGSFSGDLLRMIFVYGCFFTFFPGGIGGFLLANQLSADARSGLLTPQKAFKKGLLTAGLAGAITCLIGLTFITYFPPVPGLSPLILEDFVGWAIGRSDIFLSFAKMFFIEIPTVVIIAGAAGGLTGQLLAKHLHNSAVPVIH